MGMHPIMEQHEKKVLIWNNGKKQKASIIITNVINLTSGYDIISYINLDKGAKPHMNISVVLSAAVTARMYMAQFKIKFIKEGIIHIVLIFH